MWWQAEGNVVPAIIKYLEGVGRQRWPRAPRSMEEIAALVDDTVAGDDM